jgi:hypothetical protein
MSATTIQSAVPTAEVADHLAIQQAASELGLLVDARDWDSVRALFTDSVDVDYVSLNGGQPQTTPAPQLIDGWRQALDNLDATQHLIAGPDVTIDGDEAICAANVQATHVLANPRGGELWTVGGRYDFCFTRTPAGWRIRAVKLSVQWVTGNQHIIQLAASRSQGTQR